MKLNKSLILAGTALIGLFATTAAFAQSTATQEVEDKATEVVVKGNRLGAGIINKETGTKSKSVLGQDFISTQPAGQTIAEALNVIPGVNFTNNDPYGSSGGQIFVRGLDDSRVSLTFDGVQLNDAGNYAIYTNQQMDPELIETASVLSGGTDLDSVSASSTGGTVNYTTRKTRDAFGLMYQASLGSFNYGRSMAIVDTGKIGPWGTKAWFAISGTKYNTFTNDININDQGAIKKTQYNFRVDQDFFDNGSYISVMGHYNENRNNFIFGQSTANFKANGLNSNTAGKLNINPSNTGDIRIKSKWVLADNLILTVDPSWQYVLANGGGSATANEKTGKIGSWTLAKFVGVDVNGDGDALDTSVALYSPNITHTERLGLQSGLIWTLSDTQMLRFNASFDRARTRQTGEASLLTADGYAKDVFSAVQDRSLAIFGSDKSIYGKRNRFSKANVDVFSVEYRGKYFDDALTVVAGLRSQKLERELNQYCYSGLTGNGSSSPLCTTQAPDSTNPDGTVKFSANTYTTAGVTYNAWFKPYKKTVSFSKVSPSFGLTYKLSEKAQVYGNYFENMSSPRTDQYYQVVMKNGKMEVANPNAETVKGFEGGYRYNGSKVTVSTSAWTKKYENRIVSSYDADTDTFFDRNVGTVDMFGGEASLGYKPNEKLNLFFGASYTSAEMQDNVANGEVKTALGSDTVGTVLYIPTAGKQLVEVPDWMYNFGISYDVTDKAHVFLNGKYVGDRFATDLNDVVAPSYTVWNASLRYDLEVLKKGAFLQLNVINLTDEYYYGNLSTTATATTLKTASGTTIVTGSAPTANLGAPRTVMLTLRTQF